MSDAPVGPSGSRRAARERALALLYEAESKRIDAVGLLETLPVRPDQFVVELIEGIAASQPALDETIDRLAHDWTVDRMPAIDRAILRMAVFELQNTDVPPAAAMNEAVELANEYSTDSSGRFVNGVLAQVAASR